MREEIGRRPSQQRPPVLDSARGIAGKILSATTVDAMERIAAENGRLVDGKIDLRGQRVRFAHADLDLQRFLLAGADLSGSELLDCRGQSAAFEGCLLKDVRMAAKHRRSLAGADFSGCRISDSYFGPATLDLSNAIFTGATLVRTEFMLGRLSGVDFRSATLVDVSFRRASLDGASFQDANLTRVSLERADLHGADFSGATFQLMEHWGEPDFDGAIIADELAFQYGIVTDPFERIGSIAGDPSFSAEEREEIGQFRAAAYEFVGLGTEAMLIGSEFDDAISRSLFVKVMKKLKRDPAYR